MSISTVCLFLMLIYKKQPLLLSQGCGSGSDPFSVKAESEARKIHRFHIGGKNGGRKKIGSAILRRRTNRGSINIKESERGEVV